jgi:hypothetical protein
MSRPDRPGESRATPPIARPAGAASPCPTPGLHLAPHAVVRAARWSIDGLLSLTQGVPVPETGDPTAHEQRLRQELRGLWRHTMGSEDFRKALAVSHPELYGRLRHAPCPRTWNKAARQLVATLYRQWARACWRTEPSGLWAGVGLVPLRAPRPEHHAGTVCRVAVAPHLQPFAAMLDVLARTDAYVRRGRFKVHPSALRESPGVWLVRVVAPLPGADAAGPSAPERTRRLRLRHIDLAAADRCIDALAAQGALPYSALLRIAARLLKSEVTAQALVDQLMSARLLVGGLALPLVFETAWQALDKAALDLLPVHRGAWQSALNDLRALCQDLEQHHAALDADAVWQRTREAASRIERLAQQLAVGAIGLPRACLHWDAGLPAALHLEAAEVERARRALVAHERYHRLADPLVALHHVYARSQDEGRQAALQRVLTTQPDWDSLAAALRTHGDDGGLGARLAAQRLGADQGQLAGDGAPAATPFGALMLRLGRTSALVQGLSHEPWLAYARFGALLGRHAPHAHPLHAWCDSALTLFSQTANVTLTQVRTGCAPMANLLAQPRFSAARPLDPYGTTPGALSDAGLQLCHDGERRWLQSPTVARPVVALCATALDLGSRDPLLERVLLTGWRYRVPGPAASWRDPGPAGQARRLAPDVLRRRARWRLEGEEALALARAEPAARWALWQALARERRWPALLTVACDGEPAVPMPRDSALAVEVMFRVPGSLAPVFDIEAPEDECLIEDAQGGRYATELVLVFSREQHAWNLLGQGMGAGAFAQVGPVEAAVCAVD